MKKKTYFINNNISVALAIILLVVGIAIFSYPSISNYLVEKNQVKIIENYKENIVSKKDLTEERKKAEIYNENLAGDPLHDPFVPGSGYAIPDNYFDILNINGIMAYIEIPKISLNLPIYHGTSEEVLAKGVGHIEATSLPIGGESRHCILTGHRGLPSAELFTRLDELKLGDYFYINVLDEILTYKIINIVTVLPTELEYLEVVKEKDLVTLVTCTPYGINTHRLLVTAERTAYVEPEKVLENSEIQKKSVTLNYTILGMIIGIIVLIILLIIIFLFSRKKTKGRRYNK